MGLFLIVILTAWLNLRDSVFTKRILACGGTELNPIIRIANEFWGDSIWTFKMVVVPGCLFVLWCPSEFRRVKTVIMILSLIFAALVVYETILYLFIV